MENSSGMEIQGNLRVNAENGGGKKIGFIELKWCNCSWVGVRPLDYLLCFGIELFPVRVCHCTEMARDGVW